MACGGRVRWDHGDGGWRWSSDKHLHGAGAYRVLTAGTGGCGGLLGSWWCCCGDEWVAQRELALAMTMAEAGKSSVLRLLRRVKETEVR